MLLGETVTSTAVSLVEAVASTAEVVRVVLLELDASIAIKCIS
jgi:hypothetical protein